MVHQRRPRDNAVGELVIAVFALSGILKDTGNLMLEDLGLTSAWWQVLGALERSPAPLPVAHIARNMGLARQSVQRIVDAMADKGFVELTPNPHHQRAKLVTLTKKGRVAIDAALSRQEPWATDLSDQFGVERIEAALATLTEMQQHLADALPSRVSSAAEA